MGAAADGPGDPRGAGRVRGEADRGRRRADGFLRVLFRPGHVGAREVVADEHERASADSGKGVGETVSEIEAGGVPALAPAGIAGRRSYRPGTTAPYHPHRKPLNPPNQYSPQTA